MGNGESKIKIFSKIGFLFNETGLENVLQKDSRCIPAGT